MRKPAAVGRRLGVQDRQHAHQPVREVEGAGGPSARIGDEPEQCDAHEGRRRQRERAEEERRRARHIREARTRWHRTPGQRARLAGGVLPMMRTEYAHRPDNQQSECDERDHGDRADGRISAAADRAAEERRRDDDEGGHACEAARDGEYRLEDQASLQPEHRA